MVPASRSPKETQMPRAVGENAVSESHQPLSWARKSSCSSKSRIGDRLISAQRLGDRDPSQCRSASFQVQWLFERPQPVKEPGSINGVNAEPSGGSAVAEQAARRAVRSRSAGRTRRWGLMGRVGGDHPATSPASDCMPMARDFLGVSNRAAATVSERRSQVVRQSAIDPRRSCHCWQGRPWLRVNGISRTSRARRGCDASGC